MSDWHRRYCVSGSIQLDDRIDDWCALLRSILQIDSVGAISHYSGAKSVFAFSPIAEVVSSGFAVHEILALVPGQQIEWLGFVDVMASALRVNGFPNNLIVHEEIRVLE